MVPDGAAGVVAFLIFVAPGALFEFLVARGRPLPADTTFREINRVVLVSIVVSVAATVLVFLPRVLAPTWQEALVESVRNGHAFWRDHLADVAAGTLLFFGVAMVLAALLAWAWTARRPGGAHYDESQWYLVFRRKLPAKSRPYVVAIATNGERHFGDLIAYSVDHTEPANRDITLGEPVHWSPKATSTPRLLRNVHRVVLTGDQAAQLYVTYRKQQ